MKVFRLPKVGPDLTADQFHDPLSRIWPVLRDGKLPIREAAVEVRIRVWIWDWVWD